MRQHIPEHMPFMIGMAVFGMLMLIACFIADWMYYRPRGRDIPIQWAYLWITIIVVAVTVRFIDSMLRVKGLL